MMCLFLLCYMYILSFQALDALRDLSAPSSEKSKNFNDNANIRQDTGFLIECADNVSQIILMLECFKFSGSVPSFCLWHPLFLGNTLFIRIIMHWIGNISCLYHCSSSSLLDFDGIKVYYLVSVLLERLLFLKRGCGDSERKLFFVFGLLKIFF